MVVGGVSVTGGFLAAQPPPETARLGNGGPFLFWVKHPPKESP